MTPTEKAEDLLNFYRNYRFHIPEADCRIMALNAVRNILAVLYEHHYDSQSGAYEYWQEVEKELDTSSPIAAIA